MKTFILFILIGLVSCGGPVTGQRVVMASGECVGEERDRVERLYGEVTRPMSWGDENDLPYGCSITEAYGENGSWVFFDVKSPDECYEDSEVSGYDETCDVQ